MVTSCCVPGCKHRHTRNSSLEFYRVPQDPELRAAWLAAIGRKDDNLNKSHERICGAHFISGMKSSDPNHPDYIPSVFSHTTSTELKELRQKYEVFRQEHDKKLLQLNSELTALNHLWREKGWTKDSIQKLLSSTVEDPKAKCKNKHKRPTSKSLPVPIQPMTPASCVFQPEQFLILEKGQGMGKMVVRLNYPVNQMNAASVVNKSLLTGMNHTQSINKPMYLRTVDGAYKLVTFVRATQFDSYVDTEFTLSAQEIERMRKTLVCDDDPSEEKTKNSEDISKAENSKPDPGGSKDKADTFPVSTVGQPVSVKETESETTSLKSVTSENLTTDHVETIPECDTSPCDTLPFNEKSVPVRCGNSPVTSIQDKTGDNFNKCILGSEAFEDVDEQKDHGDIEETLVFEGHKHTKSSCESNHTQQVPVSKVSGGCSTEQQNTGCERIIDCISVDGDVKTDAIGEKNKATKHDLKHDVAMMDTCHSPDIAKNKSLEIKKSNANVPVETLAANTTDANRYQEHIESHNIDASLFSEEVTKEPESFRNHEASSPKNPKDLPQEQDGIAMKVCGSNDDQGIINDHIDNTRIEETSLDQNTPKEKKETSSSVLDHPYSEICSDEFKIKVSKTYLPSATCFDNSKVGTFEIRKRQHRDKYFVQIGEHELSYEAQTTDSGVQVDSPVDYRVQLNMETERMTLLEEMLYMRSKVSNRRYTVSSFIDNPEKVQFYTGFANFETMKVLFDFLAPHYTKTRENIISPFEQFALTLIKLRLGLTLKDLGHQVNLPHARVSESISNWFDTMYCCLTPLLDWPTGRNLTVRFYQEKIEKLKRRYFILERVHENLKPSDTWLLCRGVKDTVKLCEALSQFFIPGPDDDLKICTPELMDSFQVPEPVTDDESSESSSSSSSSSSASSSSSSSEEEEQQEEEDKEEVDDHDDEEYVPEAQTIAVRSTLRSVKRQPVRRRRKVGDREIRPPPRYRKNEDKPVRRPPKVVRRPPVQRKKKPVESVKEPPVKRRRKVSVTKNKTRTTADEDGRIQQMLEVNIGGNTLEDPGFGDMSLANNAFSNYPAIDGGFSGSYNSMDTALIRQLGLDSVSSSIRSADTVFNNQTPLSNIDNLFGGSSFGDSDSKGSNSFTDNIQVNSLHDTISQLANRLKSEKKETKRTYRRSSSKSSPSKTVTSTPQERASVSRALGDHSYIRSDPPPSFFSALSSPPCPESVFSDHSYCSNPNVSSQVMSDDTLSIPGDELEQMQYLETPSPSYQINESRNMSESQCQTPYGSDCTRMISDPDGSSLTDNGTGGSLLTLYDEHNVNMGGFDRPFVINDHPIVTTNQRLVTTERSSVTSNLTLLAADGSLVTANEPLVHADGSFVTSDVSSLRAGGSYKTTDQRFDSIDRTPVPAIGSNSSQLVTEVSQTTGHDFKRSFETNSYRKWTQIDLDVSEMPPVYSSDEEPSVSTPSLDRIDAVTDSQDRVVVLYNDHTY